MRIFPFSNKLVKHISKLNKSNEQNKNILNTAVEKHLCTFLVDLYDSLLKVLADTDAVLPNALSEAKVTTAHTHDGTHLTA